MTPLTQTSRACNETSRRRREGAKALDEEKKAATALMMAAIDSPRRDNTEYHHAMAEVRRAFVEAEAALGPGIAVRTKRRRKRNGNYVVKLVFKKKRGG